MWRFKARKVDSGLSNLIVLATQKLMELKTEHFAVPSLLFGRKHIALIGDWFFLEANDHTRPPCRYMIAVNTKKNSIALPGVREEDFFRVASDLFAAGDYEKLTCFYLFVCFDYGVFQKHCMPSQIVSAKDAECLGIEFDKVIETALQDCEVCKGKSLWWQKWGGIVFQMTIVPDDLKIEYNLITKGVGNFCYEKSMGRR